MAGEVVRNSMGFLLSVVNVILRVILHAVVLALETVKIVFLLAGSILKIVLLILSCGRMERRWQ